MHAPMHSAATATDAAVGALRDTRPEVRQMAGAFLANLALGLTTTATGEVRTCKGMGGPSLTSHPIP